ncbi:putative phosphatidate phosphatase [Helianthus annuus]|nr:putative phosphatidate phosphatase [Helianthus annuus]
MYAVGRLSSYITRGVSTVSGPFHPFGGAVDIIVVQQQDGSLKSSPWYVRFGKFQGVLKVKERVVDIHVNGGAAAGFQMYLNPKGEAYFLREGTDPDSKSQDCDFGKCKSLIDANNGQSFSRTLGFTLERKDVNDDGLLNEDGNPNVDQKSAEIAADLLERKWSTSLSRKANNENIGEHVKFEEEVISGKLESSLVLHEEHFVHKPKDDENEEVAKEVDKVIIANVDKDGIVEIYESYDGSLGNNVVKEEPSKVVEASCTEVSCTRKESVVPDDNDKSNGQLQEEPERVVEQHVTFTDRVDDGLMDPEHGSNASPCTIDRDIVKGEVERVKALTRKYPSDGDVVKTYKLMEELNLHVPHTKSLPNILPHFDEFDTLDSRQRFAKWEMVRKDASRIIKAGIEQAKLKNGDGSNIDTGKSWTLWPFGRSKSKRFSQKEQQACKKDSELDNRSEVDGEKDREKDNLPKPKKIQFYKGLTPTPEQLQSLNLTEGKNTVTFKFSTAVLGNQQVDARIFLWKWDTHIVISDVDGTITKSDVLGQFMPMVGKDWSHIGVTNLFSAIKDNGYEILFLSARSISQADVTRQFLINLKQDGKTLPEGPVVISPDGLFPSLFREVIRRAPHEFKIACLEDIRVCFPDDWNPFYAGFGNRDTDEFSYVKVGIPKGRIFIINPKGEVVVNRCNETKTYNSIHSIVNGIFPPKSEQQEQKQEQEQEGG